ncbi:MAG: hypothetical protein EBU17_01380, partial [Burkholderiaceae bacterium]|nr:hypothetical protein [Burkholderiaceae bacterium]
PALETVAHIVAHQLCIPVLIGPEEKIQQLAKDAQINLAGIEIINTSSDPIEAAKKSVQLTQHMTRLKRTLRYQPHSH